MDLIASWGFLLCLIAGSCLTALLGTIECHRREAASEREAEIVQDFIRNPKAVERRLTRQAIDHLQARVGVEFFS